MLNLIITIITMVLGVPQSGMYSLRMMSLQPFNRFTSCYPMYDSGFKGYGNSYSISGVKSGFDSLNVRLVGNWPFGPAYAVYANVDTVFLSSGGGIYILDVSNPSSPMKIGEIRTKDMVEGLFYSNGYLYVVDRQRGLEIWDVRNGSAPQKVGFYFTPGWSWNLYVSGNYAYVADGDSGLRVIDVSNPVNPQEVGYSDTPGYAEGVYVSGNYAYVADGYSGLRVIDVSNPVNPREVGYYGTPSWLYSVCVSGSYAYVADWDFGLRVIDVSNPGNPQEVGYYDTPGYAWDVYVSGNYAYVADGAAGLQIYEFYGTGISEEVGYRDGLQLRFLSPFKFDLEFSVPRNERVEFKLFDVSGRRVWRGEFTGGKHRVRKELETGIYFLRIRSGKEVDVRKVMILR